MADRVGFEPTSLLRDYLISSQGRYDHFDTCPDTASILPAFPEKSKRKSQAEVGNVSALGASEIRSPAYQGFTSAKELPPCDLHHARR